MAKTKLKLDEVKFNIRRKIVDTVLDISLNNVDPSVAKQQLAREMTSFKQMIQSELVGVDSDDATKYKAGVAQELRDFGRRLQLIGESVSQEIQILVNDLK